MSPLRLGRCQLFLKLGLAVCFSFTIYFAFSTWDGDRSKSLNQVPADADLKQTTTSTTASSAEILRLKTLSWSQQRESFTWKTSNKHSSTNPHNPQTPSSTSTETSLTVPTESVNTTIVDSTVQLTVDQPKSTPISAAQNSAVKFILLMSYMRSGSSMTSELLQQSEFTFFMFEPFWGVYGSAHRRPNVVCAQDLSNTCKNPEGFDQSEQGNLMLLEGLFNCRFKHLPIGVLESFAVFYPNTGYNASNLCFPKGIKKYPRSIYRTMLKSKVKPVCFDILEDLCQKAKVRVIKTIRLPLSFAENILKRMPDLKIVHLLRDPRGMINSRAKIKYIDLNFGIAPVKRLCDSINEDLEVFGRLMSQNASYSERIIILFYDCLVVNPFQISKFLFQYLNLDFNQNVVKWISSHMNSNTLYKEEFVKAGNSSDISRTWRTSIKFEIVEMIDKTCEMLYEKVGLRKFENLHDLRNITKSNLVDVRQCQTD